MAEDKASGSETVGNPSDSVRKTEGRALGQAGVEPASGANSSEERCPICLEDFEDKAFIGACFHILYYSYSQVYLVKPRSYTLSPMSYGLSILALALG